MPITSKGVKITVCSILFQLCWFALVWSAGSSISTAVSVLCICLSVAQLALFAKPLSISLRYLIAGVAAGVVMDSALTYTGVHTPVRIFIPWPFTPGWLLGLWFIFVTYTRTGLDSLRGRYAVPALAGVVCGPLAWLGGFKMGACEINSNALAGYGVIAVSWSVMTVVLFQLSDKLQVKDD